MKHGSNQRRGRSRGSGKRHTSPRNQTFDSNGPEGKVRGTPQQILDKYLSLARDAASAGEHIAAEGFYQFAEHYFRVLNADQQHRQRLAEQQQQRDGDAAAETEGAEPPASTAADGGDQPENADDAQSQPAREGKRGNGRRRGGNGNHPDEASAKAASENDAVSDAPAGDAADAESGADATEAQTDVTASA